MSHVVGAVDGVGTERCREFFALGIEDVGYDDLRALSNKFTRNPGAKARAASGYNGCFSCQSHINASALIA